MRALARSMVFATATLLFVAMIAAHEVLSHGSGTYFATFMFVPFALGPGVLVWFQPTARSFTIWSGCSAVASLIYLIGGSPYSYETELAGWCVIATSMYGAMLLACPGAAIMAWLLAARDREALVDSPRARRIRGIAKLAPLVAVTTLVLQILLVEHHLVNVTFASLGVLGLTLAPATYVHRRPTRRIAFVWAIWSLPFAALAALLTLSDDGTMPLLARMFVMSAGTLAALLVVVLPVSALLATDRSELPEAREL